MTKSPLVETGKLQAIGYGQTRRFTRGDAVLDVKRTQTDEVSYRQGGEAGVWETCSIWQLAKAMVDGRGEWVHE